jgi:hypothetical protein
MRGIVGAAELPWELNGTSIPETYVLPCVTLIFRARLSICPEFGCTVKCSQDLGKAGQTTGVSYSTHGPSYLFGLCTIFLDHI